MEPNKNKINNINNINKAIKIFDSVNGETKEIDLKFGKKQTKSQEINSKININTINNQNNSKETNLFDDFEKYDDTNNINIEPMWKSDIIQKEKELDLLEIISISIPTKKPKKEYKANYYL